MLTCGVVMWREKESWGDGNASLLTNELWNIILLTFLVHCRAMASQSMTGSPRSMHCDATTDLPQAIPPVSPMSCVIEV